MCALPGHPGCAATSQPSPIPPAFLSSIPEPQQPLSCPALFFLSSSSSQSAYLLPASQGRELAKSTVFHMHSNVAAEGKPHGDDNPNACSSFIIFLRRCWPCVLRMLVAPPIPSSYPSLSPGGHISRCARSIWKLMRPDPTLTSSATDNWGCCRVFVYIGTCRAGHGKGISKSKHCWFACLTRGTPVLPHGDVGAAPHAPALL